jgi:FtsP/CotA-like multicopper oxidase with cupredoxin domain
MTSNRRGFFSAITAGATAVAAGAPKASDTGGAPIPVEVPDSKKLECKVVDGVKEFRLIAEVVKTEFIPGRAVTAWGFNGCVPGPAIEVNEGERVRIIFENHLPEPTAPHWHGLEIPNEMDGVPGITQDPIPPGGRFVYEFTLEQNGTYFYHSHMPMQEMMGLIGLFIIHPKRAHQPAVNRDFAMILQEWAILPNNTVPNTMAMEYNWLTMNGKAGPAITPMLVRQGERVRIRVVNLGMDHHPIHLHGYQFVVTGSEGGRQPESTWAPGNTVIVGVAQARDIEFVAKRTGEWMLHCHMPHHTMNQMASMVGPVMSMGGGIQTGAGMEEGMGMVRQANALSEELGPSLGRTLGASADRERFTSNLVGAAMDPAMEMYPKDDPAKKQILGYPQDMWMVMDEMFRGKPETLGLRRGWTGGMMGMMTLVRVLPPETFDKIMQLHGGAAEQTKARRRVSHILHGRVEAVGAAAGTITVSHGKVEGWMDAMSMAYRAANPDELRSIPAGAQIRATVYDGDYTLHDIQVVRPGDPR